MITTCAQKPSATAEMLVKGSIPEEDIKQRLQLVIASGPLVHLDRINQQLIDDTVALGGNLVIEWDYRFTGQTVSDGPESPEVVVSGQAIIKRSELSSEYGPADDADLEDYPDYY